MYFPIHNLPYVLSSVFMPQSLSPAGISVYTGKIATCEFTWKELHVIMKFTCSFHMNSVWIVREIHVSFTFDARFTWKISREIHMKFTWISYVAILPVYRCMAGVSNISYIGPHRLNNPEAHIVLRLSKRCSCNVFFYHFRLVVGQTPMVLVQWQVAFQVVRPMSVPSIIQRSHIDAYWSDIGRLLTRVRTDICMSIIGWCLLMFVHKVLLTFRSRTMCHGWGETLAIA